MLREPEHGFISPSEYFDRVEATEDLSLFRSLMAMQYGFAEKTLDRTTLFVLKFDYWRKAVSDVLVVVKNPLHQRAGQIGSVLGYMDEQVSIFFCDPVITLVAEEDLLVIPKLDISPASQIDVSYLDDNWEAVLEQGRLIGYELNVNRPPIGHFLIQMEDGSNRRQEDWSMLNDGQVKYSTKNEAIVRK